MHFYDYIPQNDNFGMALLRSSPRRCIYDINFTSSAMPKLIGSEDVSAEYYCPRVSEPAPLVILLHGMGNTSLIPPRLLARALSSSGFICFIPRLVINSMRTPRIKDRATILSPEEWLESYRASVIEVRQIIDWAQKRPEIDSNRIAILGISFGAFIAALSIGVEPRISSGVLIECGGNSVKINQLSSTMRKHYPGPPIDHAKLLREYNLYLSQIAEHGFENVIPTNESFLTDPLTYAQSIKQRSLLMINALSDELIPRQSTIDLWEATGKQPILWLPGNHISVWIWYPIISNRVKKFFISVFK